MARREAVKRQRGEVEMVMCSGCERRFSIKKAIPLVQNGVHGVRVAPLLMERLIPGRPIPAGSCPSCEEFAYVSERRGE